MIITDSSATSAISGRVTDELLVLHERVSVEASQMLLLQRSGGLYGSELRLRNTLVTSSAMRSAGGGNTPARAEGR